MGVLSVFVGLRVVWTLLGTVPDDRLSPSTQPPLLLRSLVDLRWIVCTANGITTCHQLHQAWLT